MAGDRVHGALVHEDVAAELRHDLLRGHEAPAVALVPVLDVGAVDLLRDISTVPGP